MSISQAAVRGCSVFSLVSLTGKGFSEIKSFWYSDLNYREPTGISSQPELIPDRRRKLFCVMGNSQLVCGFMCLCDITGLSKALVQEKGGQCWSKQGNCCLLYCWTVSTANLILSVREGSTNACRSILHLFPCHSRLICQEANTDKLHWSKRENSSVKSPVSLLRAYCVWVTSPGTAHEL